MTVQFKELLNKINPEILKNPNIHLVENGIIDSFDIMNLIAEIEYVLKLEIDPDDVTPDTFASAETIWEFFEKYEAAKNAN